jgi:glucuronate isomerase
VLEKLKTPAFRPRHLFQKFNVEVLATTDAATDTLSHHQAIQASGWQGRVIPTFRPDGVVNMDMEGWLDNIHALSQASNIEVVNVASYIAALENRRVFFIGLTQKSEKKG